jgi:hypothetical protein
MSSTPDTLCKELIDLQTNPDREANWLFLMNWKAQLLLVRIAEDLYFVEKCKCRISECQDITRRLVNWSELENYLKRGFLD